MKQDDVFCLYDGKGRAVHNIHVFTDENGRVCVSYYDTRGNFEGTMRHESVGEACQVDLLDSNGTVVDTLACDVEVGRPAPASG